MNKDIKVVPFEFNSEKYKATDFVSSIASAIKYYAELAGYGKEDEIQNILSIALGFIDYNNYINKGDRNERIHELLLNEFYEEFHSVAKECGGKKNEMVKSIFNCIIRDAYYGAIPLSFKLTDVFEMKLMSLDEETVFDSKRGDLINKLIIPLIKELDINEAKSIADIVRFCNINYVYGLLSRLGKSRYMRNLKAMKRFKKYYVNELDEFSEEAEGFWSVCFRDYNSPEIIFERYFRCENMQLFK